jgi:hypothetical protein
VVKEAAIFGGEEGVDEGRRDVGVAGVGAVLAG